MPAAGSGRRFGDKQNKLLALLAGKALWLHAAQRLRDCALVGRIIMPVSRTDRAVFENQFAEPLGQLGIDLVDGGRERTDSVAAGLNVLADDDSASLIAVHDAARPLVSQADLFAVFAAAAQSGAAILASPVAGTIKRALGGNKPGDNRPGENRCETVDRRDLWIALTPQVFKPDVLRLAYAKYRGRPATDDAELVERIGHGVTIVKGSPDNLKITLPEDLLLAEAILARQNHHA